MTPSVVRTSWTQCAQGLPGAVIRDEGTRGLSAAVQDWLDERYEPSGIGDVWLRRARQR